MLDFPEWEGRFLALSRYRGDSREDRDDSDVSGVEHQNENHPDEIVHHSINLVPLTLAHQSPEIRLPHFGECWVFESEKIENENGDQTDG